MARGAGFSCGFPGGGKIELLEPLGDGFLSQFLDRYGEGLHHVTFKTDDIGAAIEELQGAGYELVDVTSTTRIGGRLSCDRRARTER